MVSKEYYKITKEEFQAWKLDLEKSRKILEEAGVLDPKPRQYYKNGLLITSRTEFYGSIKGQGQK